MSFVKRIALLLSFFWLFLKAEAQPAKITALEATQKIEEILQAHAYFKSLNEEIAQRTLENYVEELDPTKTYFLDTEIAEWLFPSKELLHTVLSGLQTGNFTVFEKIEKDFSKAVERRSSLEAEIQDLPLLCTPTHQKIKELGWTSSLEELKERLLMIRSLQWSASSKMGKMEQEQFLDLIQARRRQKEEKRIKTNKEHTVATYVLKAFTLSLDSHTNFLTPIEANHFMTQVQQKLVGIGAQLRDGLDGLSIVRLLEGGPALRSNLIKINDKIIAVDHEPIVGMELADAVDLIRGTSGTKVCLTILRSEEDSLEPISLEIELLRDEIVLEELRFETRLEPFGSGNILYFHLFSFYNDDKSPSSAKDLKKVIEEAQTQGPLKGVVLDLRDNAGGRIEQAIEVTKLFMQSGIVVSFKDELGHLSHQRVIHPQALWGGPLCVLVNRGSASAAEIVAGTLQDYGRALICGDDRTFGKGTMQSFTLTDMDKGKINPQGEYKVTRSIYYTVSGRSPQLTGVASDIQIPGILSSLDIGEMYEKYPLPSDKIAPQFEDTLSDLPPFARMQFKNRYFKTLQKQMTTYVPYLNTLKHNSMTRVKNNKLYQKCLTEMKNKHFDHSSFEVFHQADFQLIEAMNVMKDLISCIENQR